MDPFDDTTVHLRRRRTLRPVTFAASALLAAVLSVLFTVAAPASAHDGIASSTPSAGATIDAPISDVEIDFGTGIADNVSMFLTYDLGDANIEDLGGTTTKTGDTTARLDFDRIKREGRYFVRYLAPAIDGHVIAGSVSFTWGDKNGSGSGFPLIPFIGLAALVLAVGAWFSYRRMLVGDDVEVSFVSEELGERSERRS